MYLISKEKDTLPKGLRPFKNILHFRTALVLVLLFFMANLFSLMQFPLVHSDEIWLKGLSLEVWHQRSFNVTEPFYDLYPRVPHPFRWLFNLLQLGFVGIFGNSLFSVRLLSLVASTSSLIVFYKILRHITKSEALSLSGLSLLMLNIQWLYAAHFGRQEALIMLLMLLSYWNCTRLNSTKWLALILLLGIGIHPNSFLIGFMICLLLCHQIYHKMRPLRDFFVFIGITMVGCIIYLGSGFLMTSDFLMRYLSFGASLGVDAVPMSRLQNYYWFWVKLYGEIGGTYELFNIRIELCLLAILVLVVPFIPKVISKQTLLNRSDADSHLFDAIHLFEPYIALVSILLGLFIIGRNNQTSVVFLLPFVILMLFNLVSIFNLKKQWRMGFSIGITLFALFNLQGDLKAYTARFPYAQPYEVIQREIGKAIPHDAAVLGNINIMEGQNTNQFYDIRNLAYLQENNLTLQDYIDRRHIQYIAIHDEMDYIASCSPKWDFLYVNMNYWDELNDYLTANTELISEIDNPLYAMRISKYAGTYPWKTKIYRILP